VTPVAPVLEPVTDVFPPITTVFEAITDILTPVANVFETVAHSTVVARIPAVLEPIQAVLTAVHHIFTLVAAILAPVTHIFDSIAGDRPATGRALREQRSRAHEGEQCRNGDRMQGYSWRTHNEQPPDLLLLPGW
jgi:hypothetical protein